MLFRNRSEAGRVLAESLKHFANRPDVLILALPRGGVPVAYEVARELNVPLDVFVVRKLGAPGQEELAIGAIASGGIRVLNHDAIEALEIPMEQVEAIAAREQAELERRERAFRGDRPAPEVQDRTVILIDDGLATGSTMRAAAAASRRQKPARLVVAVPVAAPSTCEEFQSEADEIVCTATPLPFFGVGQWYEDFSQTRDEEVRDLIERAAQQPSTRAA